VNYGLVDTLTGSMYASGGGSATDGNLTGVPNYGESDEWLFKIGLVPNGLQTISADNLVVVYPNPSQDYIYVTLPQSSEGKIVLTDISGREISVTNTNGQETETLKIGTLPSGVYILQYQDANMAISRKVVKE